MGAVIGRRIRAGTASATYVSKSGSRELRYLVGSLALLSVSVAVLYGLSQAFLPGIAADRLRNSLEQHAQGVRVSVSASPAFELLFGHADRVEIQIKQLYPGTSSHSLGDLLARTREANVLNVSVRHMYTRVVELENVSLHKRGSRLSLSATVTRAALEAALPGDLRLNATDPNAQTLALTATTKVLGHTISGRALIMAVGSRLEIAPDYPVLGLFHVTLFSDPRVSVDSLRAVEHGSSYGFIVHGHLIG